MKSPQPYSESIHLRLEPDLRKVVIELAERDHLRPSEWVRAAIRRVVSEHAAKQKEAA